MNYFDFITALNEAGEPNKKLFHAEPKSNGDVVDIMRKRVKVFTIYRYGDCPIELFNFRYTVPAETEIIMEFLRQPYNEWFD